MIKHIVVTQKNIDEGKPHKAHACPLACAFHDAGYQRVTVSCSTVYLVAAILPKNAIGLPYNAITFLKDFDLGRPVVPFEFDIEVPA